MSVIVASGSAQFVAVPMIAAGASAGLIALTTYVISLRHYLMAASLAPVVRHLPRWAQALMAYGINDESYALTIARWRRRPAHAAYFFGSASGMYGAWFSSSAAGGLLGVALREPERYGLDFTFPAVFLALLLSQLSDRNALAVAVLAGVLALISAHLLPGKWHIVFAGIGASLAGAFLERRA
jgi:predicted branched-subunit amino acid permease